MKNWANVNQRRAIILTTAEMISRLITFFVVVRLINYLGETAYGQLSVAFALANILVVVADFGLNTYLIKHFSAIANSTSAEQQQHLGQIFILKSGLTIISLSLIVGIGLLSTELSWLTLISGGCAIIFTNTRMFFEALFRAQRRMTLEAITKTVHALVLAVVLLYGITAHFTLEHFALSYGLVAIAAAIITGLTIWTLPLKPRLTSAQSPNQTPLYWQTVLMAAWPFAVSLGINALFNYLDSVMLGWFGQFQQAGWYNTAYKPIFFITAIAGMIINAYLPSIAENYRNGNTHQLGAKVQELFATTMAVAWPLVIGGTLTAHTIFSWLFKPEFQPAVLAFQILLWSTGLIYAWAVFGNSLQVCGKENVYLKNFSVAVVITIIGNSLLIPLWSLYGAALTTLLTQLVLVALMYRDWQKFAPIRLSRAVFPPLLSSLVMGIVVIGLGDTALWLILPLAAIVYGMSLWFIRKLV